MTNRDICLSMAKSIGQQMVVCQVWGKKAREAADKTVPNYPNIEAGRQDDKLMGMFDLLDSTGIPSKRDFNCDLDYDYCMVGDFEVNSTLSGYSVVDKKHRIPDICEDVLFAM